MEVSIQLEEGEFLKFNSFDLTVAWATKEKNNWKWLSGSPQAGKTAWNTFNKLLTNIEQAGTQLRSDPKVISPFLMGSACRITRLV